MFVFFHSKLQDVWGPKDYKNIQFQLLLQQRLCELQVVLLEWGLRLNLEKCSLYTSPKHQGSSFLEVSGVRIESQPVLSLMGVQIRVGHNVRDMLEVTWQRSKGKFWSTRHLLRAKTPIKGRMQLFDRVVGSSILWNCAAFFPELNALESLNRIMFQMVVWMLRLSKREAETWEQYRMRSVRQARAMVAKHLPSRWSTRWLERWWMYMGHVARGMNLNPVPAVTQMNDFRNHEWWNRERGNPFGIRHSGRFRAKLCPMDALMNSVVKGPWREAAQTRHVWQEACSAWIAARDVPWSSGNQLALEW